MDDLRGQLQVVAAFTLGKISLFPFDRLLWGFQVRSCHCGEKNLILSEFEPQNVVFC